MTTQNFKGFKLPQKAQKGASLGIFQQNWQNHKIAISPTTKIGSTLSFDRVFELHSWLRGWLVRKKNSNSRWRTAAILQNVENATTPLPVDQFERNLGGRFLLFATCLPRCGCYGNGRCL